MTLSLSSVITEIGHFSFCKLNSWELVVPSHSSSVDNLMEEYYNNEGKNILQIAFFNVSIAGYKNITIVSSGKMTQGVNLGSATSVLEF